MTCYMVSTSDNPFNPFTQYSDWERFDIDHGYNTMSYLMRVARVSPYMEEYEYEQAITEAVNTICRLNPLGIYIKVSHENPEIVEPKLSS
jgi:hypothetical protein